MLQEWEQRSNDAGDHPCSFRICLTSCRVIHAAEELIVELHSTIKQMGTALQVVVVYAAADHHVKVAADDDAADDDDAAAAAAADVERYA